MIGASEREVRYEAQIQRLLRRPDASMRRILCLSAVFPSGSELDDFVAWITDDEPDGLHRETWRPTQQRFGLVEWRNDHARLTFTLGPDRPFIPRYFEGKKPSGRRRKLFPADQRELVIATGWRLVEDGQTVLVFCPQRNSVEPYARAIVDLHDRGLLPSVLPDGVDLTDALAVGAEWFGPEHPILQCLRLGVAIHHGALPGPFRREIERLLLQGSLKVTVASPTLAQGLNLSASAVLFHGIRRGGDLLKGSEFSNVIGRAGRAFVDTEGLVLYPVFQPTSSRRRAWHELTQGDGGKDLQSGLIEVGISLLRRMYNSVGLRSAESFLQYLTGGPEWSFPVMSLETEAQRDDAAISWRSDLGLLDVGLLSIVGDNGLDSDSDAVTQTVAEALRESLWERQLRRSGEFKSAAIRELVYSRARHLWRTSTPSQRRGWFLAGLGADAGSELAQVSGRIVALASQAETAMLETDHNAASDILIEIANSVFAIETFAPETALENWRDVLRRWVSGFPVGDLPGDRIAVVQFIEADLIYRLVWGVEAARVYEAAQGNPTAEDLSGAAVTAIETGTFNRAASILIRSGFDQRLAAISAVMSTRATFDSAAQMRLWIGSLDPTLASNRNWPTPESRSAWETFANRTRTQSDRQWSRHTKDVTDVTWCKAAPEPGVWLRVTDAGPDGIEIWSTGFDLLGRAAIRLNPERQGILKARRHHADTGVELHYRGPADLLPQS
ncbi:hypothetical protein [Streptomyces sp. NPDC060035]|uniref:hypothetical protein n=1 Tax=Streptomyces sp. NPDC060035 TaxID=3347044 RepID=UPI003690028A